MVREVLVIGGQQITNSAQNNSHAGNVKILKEKNPATTDRY